MDRRRWLAAGAGALVSSWLSGCGGGDNAGTPVTPVTPTTPDGGPYAALARQMKGQLLLPGQGNFNVLSLPANARYDSVTPVALARCVGADDVSAVLSFALANQLPFTARSGGHSYLGASTGTGLVIDTGPMDGVRMDGDIVVVGAGAKLADIYRTLLALPQPRLLPSGSCPTVGIAGIALGGGYGYFQRLYGLTCDALVGATLIGADGKTRVCDATTNPDLFWALRGGGGGNFGIVTELRLRTWPMPATSSSVAQWVGRDNCVQVLTAWSAWCDTLPDTVWSQCQIGAFANGEVGLQVGAIAADTSALLTPLWNAFIAATGVTPANNNPSQGLSASELLMGDCAKLTATQCHLPSQASGGSMPRVAMTASSDFFATLNGQTAAAIVDTLVARSKQGLFGAVLLDQMGGAIARVAPDATAFPHRAAKFSAQYLTEHMPGGITAAQLDANAAWTQGFRDQVKPWTTGGAYVNYPAGGMVDPGTAYYQGNLARLRAIKRAVDPGGVFKTPLVTF